jgi:hypothetical protein
MFAVVIGRKIDIVPAEIHILVERRSRDMPINAHVTPYHPGWEKAVGFSVR